MNNELADGGPDHCIQMPDHSRCELRLDSFVLADAATVCEVDRDPEHRSRFDFPEGFVPSLEHSAAVIARWAEERRAGVRFPFAVRKAGSDALVGGCELQPVAEATAKSCRTGRIRSTVVAESLLRPYARYVPSPSRISGSDGLNWKPIPTTWPRGGSPSPTAFGRSACEPAESCTFLTP